MKKREEDLKEKREKYEKEYLHQLERRAAEINAQITPEMAGYVRTDGPRRQCRAEVVNGMLHLTEI